jgi:hypothetical protein
MKYDIEYNAYRFSSEEISYIIHGLISYSSDPFVDHITKQNIKTLLNNINESIKISVVQ